MPKANKVREWLTPSHVAAIRISNSSQYNSERRAITTRKLPSRTTSSAMPRSPDMRVGCHSCSDVHVELLLEERVERIGDLVEAIGIEEERGAGERQRDGQHVARSRVPARGDERAGLEVEERTEEISAGNNDAEEEGSVAVDPEREKDGQSQKPARIASAAEVDEDELDDEEEIADHLGADGKADGGKKPDGFRLRQRRL